MTVSFPSKAARPHLWSREQPSPENQTAIIDVGLCSLQNCENIISCCLLILQSRYLVIAALTQSPYVCMYCLYHLSNLLTLVRYEELSYGFFKTIASKLLSCSGGKCAICFVVCHFYCALSFHCLWRLFLMFLNHSLNALWVERRNKPSSVKGWKKYSEKVRPLTQSLKYFKTGTTT